MAETRDVISATTDDVEMKQALERSLKDEHARIRTDAEIERDMEIALAQSRESWDPRDIRASHEVARRLFAHIEECASPASSASDAKLEEQIADLPELLSPMHEEPEAPCEIRAPRSVAYHRDARDKVVSYAEKESASESESSASESESSASESESSASESESSASEAEPIADAEDAREESDDESDDGQVHRGLKRAHPDDGVPSTRTIIGYHQYDPYARVADRHKVLVSILEKHNKTSVLRSFLHVMQHEMSNYLRSILSTDREFVEKRRGAPTHECNCSKIHFALGATCRRL